VSNNKWIKGITQKKENEKIAGKRGTPPITARVLRKGLRKIKKLYLEKASADGA